MTLGDWKKAADSLVSYRDASGISPSVIVWGGEPLTSPYFRQISEYLHKRNFKLGLITNGVLLDKYADTIADMYSKIYVSVDGTRDIHDSIRGEGVYDRVMKNLSLFTSAETEVIIMSVLSAELLGCIPEFLDSLEKIKPSQVLLQDMIHMSQGEIDSYTEWFKNCFNAVPSEIKSWNIALPENYENEKQKALAGIDYGKYSFDVIHKEHASDGDKRHCLSPFRHVHVAWNGNVLFCTDFYDYSAGNVRDGDIADIFMGNSAEKFRNEILSGNCVTCNHCSWRSNDSFYL